MIDGDAVLLWEAFLHPSPNQLHGSSYVLDTWLIPIKASTLRLNVPLQSAETIDSSTISFFSADCRSKGLAVVGPGTCDQVAVLQAAVCASLVRCGRRACLKSLEGFAELSLALALSSFSLILLCQEIFAGALPALLHLFLAGACSFERGSHDSCSVPNVFGVEASV